MTNSELDALLVARKTVEWAQERLAHLSEYHTKTVNTLNYVQNEIHTAERNLAVAQKTVMLLETKFGITKSNINKSTGWEEL